MVKMKEEKKIREEGRGDGRLGVTGQVEEASAPGWSPARFAEERRRG